MYCDGLRGKTQTDKYVFSILPIPFTNRALKRESGKAGAVKTTHTDRRENWLTKSQWLSGGLRKSEHWDFRSQV